MGLDVYGYLVKKARSSKKEPLKSFEEYEKLNDERAKVLFGNFASASLAWLHNVNAFEYKRIYNEIFSKMSNFTKYKHLYQHMLEEVKPFEEVVKFFDYFKSHYYAPSDLYFRGMRFIYNFFTLHCEVADDRYCIVDKIDIEELISRCEKVLADHSLANELLPPYEKYDDYYFEDVKFCKDEMKRLLSMYNEDTDVIYFEMSH